MKQTAILICFALLAVFQAAGKDWETVDGVSVSGEFVSSLDGLILIKTSQGEHVELRRERLIESDQTFLALLEKYRNEIGVQSWPRKVKTRSEVRLYGGPRTFRTDHFQVYSGGMDRGSVARLATVMEDALDAISTIPTGLKLQPPAPSTYFQVRFMDRASFDREFAKVGMHLIVPNQKVRGAYIAARRELWLPTGVANVSLDLLGATVIHEVCHQTMHDWLPLMPVWFLEGFAEYMSSIPYENRMFRFDQSEEGLSAALADRYRTAPAAINVIHPGKLIGGSGSWGNTTMEYLSSLVLVYYLIHLDGSGNGESFNRLVAEVARSKDDARAMLSDLQSIADSYNSKVATYREQLAEYQQGIAEANQQLRSGQRVFVRSKSNGRLVIAGTPAVPAVPKAPGEAPIEKISVERAKTLTLISTINHRALDAMIGQRSMVEFASQMQEAYRKRGFVVNFF
ncbi:MAG: hypothetical protein P1U89_13060 [Verrucomicrobiales bacterium]|nr:hypothetical protein [Verrucomicrobiales bacterium]